MSWWLWLVLGLVVLAGVFRWALLSYRKRVKAEFLGFLAAEFPDVQLVESQKHALTLRLTDGKESQLYLGHMYDAVSELDRDDDEGRRRVFRTLVGAVLEAGPLTDLTADEFLARLRLRLVFAPQRSQLEDEAGEPLVGQAVGAGGLCAMVVLDSPNSVRYLTAGEVSSLGLTPQACVRAATENLEADFPIGAVDRALRGDTSVIESEDGYAAGNLLVIPRLLLPGQRLLAVIPSEGDGLILSSLPEDPSRQQDLTSGIDATVVIVARSGFEEP